ncbi:hypothetical protein BC829DRAFT_407485 [Chytridium lagenaria]|nr:hypothetical protein BC829DRAFT_407485 [Chytridium lagenaria]
MAPRYLPTHSVHPQPSVSASSSSVSAISAVSPLRPRSSIVGFERNYGDDADRVGALASLPEGAGPKDGSTRRGIAGSNSNSSFRSKSIKAGPRIHQDGPIQVQMILHYIWYGILLIIADAAEWTKIWYWTFPLYIFSAFVVIEISRLLIFRNPHSMVPLYLSFIPYTVFHLIVVKPIWCLARYGLVSLMAINMQIGTPKLRTHVFFACFVFLAFYTSCTGILYQFQRNPEIGQTFAPGNTATTLTNNLQAVDIKWSAEITFIVSFVQEYAFNLIDRQNHVSRLSKQNADLQVQLKAIKKDIDLDLDSPITKVIKSIRNIQDKCDLDVDVMESLDYVIQLLSSNQLFMPNLNVNKDAIDSDVKNWLNAMITNHSEVAERNDKTIVAANPASAGDALMKPISSASDAQIQELLKTIGTWDFKLFDLVELTNGRPLYFMAQEIFDRLNLKTQFNLDETIIQSFLTKVEAGYRGNLYHNSTHAADVLQAVYFFLQTLGMKAMVKPEEILSSVVASIIHDLDHPGVNNAYLINSGSSLAIRYNDQSVLENHHCARAFEMMTTDPTCNILTPLPTEKFKQVRSCILSMVLATDMAGHFEYIAKFKNRLSGSGLQFEDAKDRQLLLDIAIKCGDISNATKSNDLCKKWADLIMEEFFRQGDEEKKNGYPVSMFMDRNNTVVSKCQVGFIDYIVSPLYEESGLFPALANLSKNRSIGKGIQQELELQKVAVHP